MPAIDQKTKPQKTIDISLRNKYKSSLPGTDIRPYFTAIELRDNRVKKPLKASGRSRIATKLPFINDPMRRIYE